MHALIMSCVQMEKRLVFYVHILSWLNLKLFRYNCIFFSAILAVYKSKIMIHIRSKNRSNEHWDSSLDLPLQNVTSVLC